MKIQIPKNEKLWVTYLSNSKEKYIVTSNKDRSTYFLYEVDPSGKLIKLSKSKDPSDFHNKVKI